MAPERFIFQITPENHESLMIYAKQKGTTASKVINQALSEFLVNDSKLKTLISGMSRLRRQVDMNERTLLAFMQSFELYVEKFFALSPPVNEAHTRQMNEKGKRLFGLFIDEAMKKNRATEMPVLLEQMNALAEGSIPDET